MTTILGVIALTLFFGGAVWFISARDALEKPKLQIKQPHVYIITLLIIGFVVRVLCASMYYGHETDMGCFTSWSSRLYREGLGNFYLSDGFHDYPPGYVYVMYILGAIKDIFHIVGTDQWVLIKMPSILADLGIGYFIYKVASKIQGNKNAAILSTFFVINPVVILNSSIWGQVDSILTLFCLIAVYFAAEKKFMASFFAFAVAFLIKPQAAFFAPVIIFALIEDIFLTGGFNSKKLIDAILKAIIAIASMFITFMPFGRNPFHGIEVIVKQYIETMGQYNYLTVNAFNLYGAFGGNWTELTPVMSAFGYLMIAAVVAFAGMVYFKSKSPAKHYIASAIIVFGVFMLSVKMHERYAFPAIAMLLMVLVLIPTSKNFVVYALFSMSQFFNIAWILFVYEKNPGAYFRSGTIIIASFINIALFIWMMYEYYKNRDGETPSAKTVAKAVPSVQKTKKEFHFQLSEKAKKITVMDIVAILVISVIYGGVAFYNLGNMHAPETETVITDNPVTVDLGKETEIHDLAFYLGARQLYEERNLTFTFLNENKEKVCQQTYIDGSVFVWNHEAIAPVTARYIKVSTNHITSETDPSELLFVREVALMDKNGDLIPVDSVSPEANIFDEQDMFSEKNFMAGTYFDEIYHPRTAYEFLEGMSVYEWTHPPLGKVLMSIGISIFGMVPFGWRVVGTVFGILMIAVIYMLAKRFCKHSWLAIALTLLFTFDFMHFSQTRLATIDTYVVFFIMLMYYFMYKYYKMSFYDTPLKKTLIPLGLSGIFFGLGVASKWTGMYAGAGLAIIFFISLWQRFSEYKVAQKAPRGETDGISHKMVINTFQKNTIITIAFCCVAFVVVPFIIYALSYIPYMDTPSAKGSLLETLIANGKSMLTYHGKTVAKSTHQFSSYWFEWPVMYRPIYYFSNTLDNGMKQGISAFGNPAVWWLGIGAVAYTTAVAIIVPLRKRNYLGNSKAFVGGAYTAIFAFITLMSYVASIGNDKLVRYPKIMFLYAVIFVGIFILVLMNEDRLKKVSGKTALFLTIGFFAQLLPWTLVLRTTYIYHYFTCIPFVVLMIGFVIKTIYDNVKNKTAVIVATGVYIAIAIGLFILFYPVLSGAPVSMEFAKKFLKWFSSWVLVS